MIVAGLAMSGHRLQSLTGAVESWVELALSLPIVLWAGKPFFVRALQSLIHYSPNMWTLIGLGTSAAFIYSVIATVAPSVFPPSFVVMGRFPVYFEAAAVIISLTLLGQVLELNARSRTCAAIKSLLGLAPRRLDGSTPMERKRTSRSRAFRAGRFADGLGEHRADGHTGTTLQSPHAADGGPRGRIFCGDGGQCRVVDITRLGFVWACPKLGLRAD